MGTSSADRTPWSLTARLAVGSAVWTAAALLIAGFLLVSLFRHQIETQFDAQMQDHLVHLVSLTRFADPGQAEIQGGLTAPLFNRPFSGWSWQIRRGDVIVAQSPSLGPLIPETREMLQPPLDTVGAFLGPGDLPSRGVARVIRAEQGTEPYVFAVAGPRSEIETALSAFRGSVVLTLVGLGAGLLATVFLLMRTGLRPLESLRARVAAMRAGTPPEPHRWPREIAPVAQELEELHAHVDRLVVRARGQAADLAHAVKTPLAVLEQLTTDVSPGHAKQMHRQVTRISGYLDRHLSRSRAAGRTGRSTAVAGCVDELILALDNDLAERGLTVARKVDPQAAFLGDEADFFELVGNLVDNARKWATTEIAVSAEIVADRLVLVVEDDGPGVPSEQRDCILARGTRLDEAAPGQGLGLAIVRDITEIHGGTVTIGESALGGAAVTLTLPGSTSARVNDMAPRPNWRSRGSSPGAPP
ncbi:MAG: ATP-binding protein [Pseudomonadota bacterium]